MALAALVILAPLVGLAAALVACERRGPILFRHRRVGRSGKEFMVIKFRTMCVDGDRMLVNHLANNPLAKNEWTQTRKLKEDPRVSSLGSFLRKSSIDELPQLINVIRGEMSIVGPRPIVQDEVILYGAHFDDYCLVRPGLTGAWQVSGRSDIGYAERIALDARYANSKSLVGDLRLIARTVPAVLNRRGSY